MPKKTRKEPLNSLIPKDVLAEAKLCRPLRLYIKKQKKKGDDANPFALRARFVQLPADKQAKYFQKSVDKYIQLLDDKHIDEHVQIEGQLFEIVMTKKEQGLYFQSISAPATPLKTAASYYAHVNKEENQDDAKAWKSLSAEERKPYVKMLADSRADYSVQIKNFAENLPDRLQPEYLQYAQQSFKNTPVKETTDDESAPKIRQRRKSAQPVDDDAKSVTHDSEHKLNRPHLDALYKCKPSELYYEQKVPDEEKPTFDNARAQYSYKRSLFHQLSEKKRKKFIFKGVDLWQEYLHDHPTIAEQQIPTLHLLLGRNEDILFYFTALGLPARPPNSSLVLYNHEKERLGGEEYWGDLPQKTKDEYGRNLIKVKNDYYTKFVEFVEKTLPSDYIRLEFFRHVKYAAKDYASATKGHVPKDDVDAGQMKITQFLVKKTTGTSEFDRIKQQLLATELTNEQKKLVDRLGQVMNRFVNEAGASVKKAVASKGTVHSSIDRTSPHHSGSTNTIVINGEVDSDAAEPTDGKKKKRRKRDRTSMSETLADDIEQQSVTSTPSKKRK